MSITLYFSCKRLRNNTLRTLAAIPVIFQMKRTICFQITPATGMHTYMGPKSSFCEVKLPFSNLVTAGFPPLTGQELSDSLQLQAETGPFFFQDRQLVSRAISVASVIPLGPNCFL